MAISFTRPDPSSPSSVASASFTTARKGFEPSEVREFLRMVAAELARLQERERFLERELRTSQRNTTPSSVALDEELVTKMLGEEAARILHTSREAASLIKQRAEEGAARLLREATDEAHRLREEAEIESARRRADATADAEAELEMAKQQGRDMVNEARAYRERVLNELARRREVARQQIEQLVHGRDRLLQAFERSRLVAVDVMAELTPLGEPSEYINLSPTTGPVPLMVPNMPRPGSQPAIAADSTRTGAAGVTEDPTIALTVPSVVPLLETERPTVTGSAAADLDEPADDADGNGVADTTVAIFVDDELEAERVAERELSARRDEELARLGRLLDSVGTVEQFDDLATDDPATDDVNEAEIEIEADAEAAVQDGDDRVVMLGIAPQELGDDHDDHELDDRAPAPVVNLFSTDRVAARQSRLDDTEAEAGDTGIDDEVEVEVEVEVGDVADEAELSLDAVEIDAVEPDELADALDAVTVEDAVVEDPEVEVVDEDVNTSAVDGADHAGEPVDPDATVALSRTSADDLFARLRAARAESVAQRAAAATQPATRTPVTTPAPATTPAPVPTARVMEPSAGRPEPVAKVRVESGLEPVLFQRSEPEPVASADHADTPFGRRDEALTPLIVSAARKLKRVLADEQNEVLHALRGKDPVRSVDAMLADEPTQGRRYVDAVLTELVAAAAAGAISMGADATTAARTVERERATAGAAKRLVADLVVPLRDRLGRCVTDADGDNGELASMVRIVYREWKNQRIDEHVDDVARTAFGRGALAGVAPGTPICWLVDPNGPECADAEDNALGGAVPAGERFPTDHRCAPAHDGCRCMIAPAD